MEGECSSKYASVQQHAFFLRSNEDLVSNVSNFYYCENGKIFILHIFTC